MRFNRESSVLEGVLASCSKKSPPKGSFTLPVERSGSRTNWGTRCRYRTLAKKSASSRNLRFVLTCSKCVWVKSSGSFSSLLLGRARRISSPCITTSRLTTGLRWLSCVNSSRYLHSSPSSRSTTTSTATFGYRRACRDRIWDTPRRVDETARWKPPWTSATSRKKRMASRKLDFPAAFGPTRKTRPSRGTSTSRKLRQFSSRMRVNRMR